VKTFAEFVLSVIALPLLVPWYFSEKIFLFLVQPLLFRKYQIGAEKKKKTASLFVRAGAFVALAFYLFKTGAEFFRMQGSAATALKNGKIFLFMIYNDCATAINVMLQPLNVVLAYARGAEVGALQVVLSFYLLFLPVLFIANLGYNLISGGHSLRRAVKLRNEAVRDVDLIRFTEAAADDQFFLGVDFNRNGAPFYVSRKWLHGHVQVIGAPGSGKTESIIQPLWFQHVRRNAPTFVIDGKGSRQNIDKFFTIASSLAQGHEIIYFNPSDPDRSASYNPLRRGSVKEIKNRILSSLNRNVYPAANRARLDHYLTLILGAIRETKAPMTLNELFQCFKSKTHAQKQLVKIRKNSSIYNDYSDLINQYSSFQNETASFNSLLREICQSSYGWLLDSETPELDLLEVYKGKKDCYFSLPITPGDYATSYLGRLILNDLAATFHALGADHHGDGGGPQRPPLSGGLLIIDEAVKFINPSFIELLRFSREIGVCVCYTNQSLAELSSPDLQLGKAFVDQLADHTNVTCCFHLGSAESIEAIIQRIGVDQQSNGGDGTATSKNAASSDKKIIVVDPNFLKHLEVGRCLVYVRQPRVMGILKTGYFKFDELLPYVRQESEENTPQS
jgi:hypothetical protein